MTKRVRYLQPHPGQKKILNSVSRFRVVACGRRFGKTETGKIEILLRASRGQHCWWLSPTYEMAEQVWRDLKRILRDFSNVKIRQTDRRIDFANGGMIAVRSANKPDNLRGAGLDFVVLDEAAFMPSEIWSDVIQPMLLVSKVKSCALFLSSPNGLNWFWNLYQLGLNHTKPHTRSWRSFHYTSYDNPLIDPAELEAIRLNTPERAWKTEYLAEFLSDSGGVFRGVREAATAPLDAQPVPGRRYVAGLDWARDNDFTCIAVFDAEAKQMVALERFHGVGWELQRGRVKALYERWLPSSIWAEANSIGGPNIEALQAEGLPIRSFTTTAQSKAPLIDALALALERRELALLPDEVLLGELIAYRMERLPGGGYKYAAASGHDDTVIATALAWRAVLYGAIRIEFV